MAWGLETNIKGPAGTNGQGVPTGGATGQVLTKTSASDYATNWQTPTGGAGGGIPEAPTDGQQYGRVGSTASWTAVVPNPTWATLSGKPATFPPTVPIAWTDVSGKPATFPPTLPIAQSDVTNLVSDLVLKAPLASPILTGTPAAPTATAGTNTTQLATTAFVTSAVTAAGGVLPSNVVPGMDGVAAAGSSALYSRGDHIHPTDTSRLAASAYTAADVLAKMLTVDGAGSGLDADLLDGQTGTYYTNAANLTGTLPAASFNDTAHGNRAGGTLHANVVAAGAAGFMTGADKTKLDGIATGAGVAVPPATVAPLMNGVAAVGSVAKYAKEDHVHPTDTSLAPKASPTFTGTVTIPTPTAGDNTTKAASTAFVTAAITASGAPAPATVAPLMDGTAAVGTTTKYAREDHRHPTDTSRAPNDTPSFTGSTVTTTGYYISRDATNPGFYMQSGSTTIGSVYTGSSNIYWTNTLAGGYLYIQSSTDMVLVGTNAYKTGGGVWATSSDARIKTVEGDYTTGLEAVKALHPVRYTYKGNDTPDVPDSQFLKAPEDRTASKEAATVPYENSPNYHQAVSGKSYVGFIAQEAETVMPDMVTQKAGYIDGQPVTDLRDIDTSELIYALVNAVKELAAEVEALKAA